MHCHHGAFHGCLKTIYPEYIVDDFFGLSLEDKLAQRAGCLPSSPDSCCLLLLLLLGFYRRLAHEAFRELKASALGIRLSDLPSALQFLFFGDSASLLTGKEAGGAAVPPGAKHVAGRTAKDVHLVMYGKPGIWARLEFCSVQMFDCWVRA